MERILTPFIDLISGVTSCSKIIDIFDISIIDEQLSKEINKKIDLLKYNKKQLQKKNISPAKKKDVKIRIEEIDAMLAELSDRAQTSLCNFLEKEIFSNKNLCLNEKSKILYIDKNEKKIAFYKELDEKDQQDYILNNLRKIVTSYNLIDNLAPLLISEQAKKIVSVFKSFEFSSLIEKSIETQYIEQLLCPISSLILKEKLLEDEIDYSDVWVNDSLLDKLYGTKIDKGESASVLYKSEIGFSIGNTAFLFFKNIEGYIKEECLLEYYWSLFKLNVYRAKSDKSRVYTGIEEFKEDVKCEDFSNILSCLINNLYIQDAIDLNLYEKHFESCFIVNKLSHIEGYDFFLMRQDSNQNLLGIYHTDRRPSDKYFHLIHWLSNKDDLKYIHHKAESSLSKEKKAVKVLKPEISFYFEHKYYENLFESVLIDLGLEYVSNYSLKFIDGKDCEIDFMIKTNNKIYIIETKTKLSSDNIRSFEKRCIQYIDAMKPIIQQVEFLLIGGFSDDNCNFYKPYFSPSKHQDYNENRDKLNTIPYWFEFEIENSKHLLTCISEPSFTRLKEIISSICL